jgi:uncharacterized protein (TIGR03437 family)
MLIYATGMDALANVTVQVGGVEVAPTAIRAVPNQTGMFQVAVALPRGLDRDGDVVLSLSGDASDGTRVHTNLVTIAIQGNHR